MFDNQNRNPPAPPDPAKALAKVLEAQRKKEEQAAAKQAEADRIAALARLAIEDHGKRASAQPFGQAAATAARGFAEAPTAAPGLPAAAVQWPTPPRGFFGNERFDD